MLLYLLLSFPLGILYFVFLVTGLSLSAGLMVTLIGFPLLTAVLAGAQAFIRLEKRLASDWLHLSFPATDAPREPLNLSFLRRAWALLKDPQTYMSVLWLLLRFPLGILNFVVTVTLGSVTVGLISTPLVYYVLNRTLDINIFYNNNDVFNLLGFHLSPWTEAWLCMGIGLLLVPVAIKALQALTMLSAKSLYLFK
jgi:hypothetical protein